MFACFSRRKGLSINAPRLARLLVDDSCRVYPSHSPQSRTILINAAEILSKHKKGSAFSQEQRKTLQAAMKILRRTGDYPTRKERFKTKKEAAAREQDARNVTIQL